LLKCRDKRPGCIQQWLSVDDVDRLPIGNRVGEISKDAREKKMVKMDRRGSFLGTRSH
jgi:hypothetical protein